jgi:hypothetical protein
MNVANPDFCLCSAANTGTSRGFIRTSDAGGVVIDGMNGRFGGAFYNFFAGFLQIVWVGPARPLEEIAYGAALQSASMRLDSVHGKK